MLKTAMAALVAASAFFAASPANAVAVSALVGEPVKDLQGEPVGPIDDLVVDVRTGRVLYVIVDGAKRYFTLPVRALEARPSGLRLDMSLVNALTHRPAQAEPRFRRAAKLLGKEVTKPGGGPIGTIRDIEFDLGSGRVERVVVATGEGEANMPASVLAHGRFPPLTRWQAEHPSPDSGNEGFVRRGPTDERSSVHEHEWHEWERD